MVYVISAILVLAVTLVGYLIYKKGIKFDELVQVTVVVFLALVLVYVGFYKIIDGTVEKAEEVEKIETLEIKGEEGTEDNLFVGIGEHKGEKVYHYLIETKDGIRVEHIPVENTYIKETKEGNSHIITYKKTYNNKTLDTILGEDLGTKRVVNIPKEAIEGKTKYGK